MYSQMVIAKGRSNPNPKFVISYIYGNGQPILPSGTGFFFTLFFIANKYATKLVLSITK